MTIQDSSVQIISKMIYNQITDQALNKLNRLFRTKDIERIASETKFIKRLSSKLLGFDF